MKTSTQHSWYPYILYIVNIVFFAYTTITHGEVITITSSKEYEEQIAAHQDTLAVIKFGATWCGSCTAVKDTYHEITKNPEFSTVAFMEASLDEDSKLGSQHGIRSIPAVLYFKEGKKVDETVGANDFKNRVESTIKTLLATTQNTPQEPIEQEEEKPETTEDQPQNSTQAAEALSEEQVPAEPLEESNVFDNDQIQSNEVNNEMLNDTENLNVSSESNVSILQKLLDTLTSIITAIIALIKDFLNKLF